MQNQKIQIKSIRIPKRFAFLGGMLHASRYALGDRRGATFIELMIAVAIIVILSAIVANPLAKYRKDQLQKTAVEDVTALLNEARSRTLLSDGSSQYGVHVESSRVVLFKGASFSEPSSNNTQITLNSALSIASINFIGNGADVVFDRLTGATSESGSFRLGLASDSSTQKVITITKTGIVSAN